MRTRIAYTASDALDSAQSPLVFASSIALVVLSSAAEIGGGEGLLRHVDSWLVGGVDCRVMYVRRRRSVVTVVVRFVVMLSIVEKCLCLGVR